MHNQATSFSKNKTTFKLDFNRDLINSKASSFNLL